MFMANAENLAHAPGLRYAAAGIPWGIAIVDFGDRTHAIFIELFFKAFDEAFGLSPSQGTAYFDDRVKVRA